MGSPETGDPAAGSAGDVVEESDGFEDVTEDRVVGAVADSLAIEAVGGGTSALAAAVDSLSVSRL